MAPGKEKQKAIFLDRDGTLNEDKGYVHKIEDFKLLPGVIEGLKLLKNHFIFFIVTNQSGIGRGYYTYEDFLRFNEHLVQVLKSHDIEIKKTYVCPHIPEDNCECRKPKINSLLEARKQHGIDLTHSWVIGDHPTDVLLGINAGCKTVYLLSGHGNRHLSDLEQQSITPTLIANNFLEAATLIMDYIKDKHESQLK
ncbi:MAG: D-glycero-alpha-D-manno-heptose-1,7-bisphosphate 7-phosphatase [Promethearchaeota archaeon]